MSIRVRYHRSNEQLPVTSTFQSVAPATSHDHLCSLRLFRTLMEMSDLPGSPRDVLSHIRRLAGLRARTQTSQASRSMHDSMLADAGDAGDEQRICLFVIKRLDKRKSYWWVGRKGVMRGPSSSPPRGVSKSPGDALEVERFCLSSDYEKRCVAFMHAFCAYVEHTFRMHLQRNNDTQQTYCCVLFERPEDAHSSRWEPDFAGGECGRTGCCVAVIIPPARRAFVTLGHASSMYAAGRRRVLLAPTPLAKVFADTAPRYMEFFLDRGRASSSIAYMSLWQRAKKANGIPFLTPALPGLRMFGAQFAPVNDSETVPHAVGMEAELPMRQFGQASLKLRIDLHAISAPFEKP